MDLLSLNHRWWDWRIESWNGWSLRLIADNDLTYHHAVEVLFEGVRYVSLPAEFSHPVFREASEQEAEYVRTALEGDLDGVTISAWDTDADAPGKACLVAAQSVVVTEGMVAHK